MTRSRSAAPSMLARWLPRLGAAALGGLFVRSVRRRRHGEDRPTHHAWPSLPGPGRVTLTATQGPVAAESPVSPGNAVPWTAPDDAGGCPPSHPLKANASSMIYHVPSGTSYARTRAERCYCDERDAERDGFRRAKR